jgi:hypothetical protein
MPRPEPQDRKRKIVKRPVTETLWLVDDLDLLQRYKAAESRFLQAQTFVVARPDDALASQELETRRAEFDTLAAEMRDHGALKFVFRAIGRKRYEELLLAHPPTDEQIKDPELNTPDGRPTDFNPDTFSVALVAASLADPLMNDEEVREEIFESDDWNGNEIGMLIAMATKVNMQALAVNLGNA